jgi:hypothetical protein
MKTCRGTDVYPHTFLTLVPDGVSGSFMTLLLYPKKKIEGWVGSIAAIDATEKIKMSCSPAVCRFTDRTILALINICTTKNNIQRKVKMSDV